jgi:S-adenosylmethionine decarboxylase
MAEIPFFYRGESLPDESLAAGSGEGVGVHYIGDLYGCPSDLLNSSTFLTVLVETAVQVGKITLLRTNVHEFQPCGITVLAMLAESHISVHTWPEHKYAAVDLFTCGNTARPSLALSYMVRELQSEQHLITVLHRGKSNRSKD